MALDFLLSLMDKEGYGHPELAVVLGSGLGAAAPDLENALEVTFGEIPAWPQDDVKGHEGLLRYGYWRGMPLLVQLGRLHYYQGLNMDEVTLPVRCMAELGVKAAFMSNAAGALNPIYVKGQFMLVRDHINLMGENPLRGVKDGEGQPAFLDISTLYEESAGDLLVERARLSGWEMDEGILVAVSGPSYETGAELRFMRLIGEDAVSMSLVPETLVAHFLGISVTAVSIITNIWDLRRPQPISHDEVVDIALRASPVLKEVIEAWLEQYASRDGG
jgi:purine-nucleoside phosphorylase